MSTYFRELQVALLIAASVCYGASAQSVKHTYEFPDGISVDCTGQTLNVLGITQFERGYFGAPISSVEEVDGVDLSLLRDYWQPADRNVFRSIHLGDVEYADFSDEAFDGWMADTRRKHEFTLHSMFHYQIGAVNRALVRCLYLDEEKRVEDIWIIALEERGGEWRISKTDNDIISVQYVFEWMTSYSFAYLVSGDPALLSMGSLSEGMQSKLTEFRASVVNSNGELSIGKLYRAIIELRDGYSHVDMSDLLLIDPPYKYKRTERRVALSQVTTEMIAFDLRDSTPQLRKAVLASMRSGDARRTQRILGNYGRMTRPDANDLVEKWMQSLDK